MKKICAFVFAFGLVLSVFLFPYSFASASDIGSLENTFQRYYVATGETETVHLTTNLTSSFALSPTGTEGYIPQGVSIAPMPTTIFPPDDRIEITNVNTFPYCATVYIEVTLANGQTTSGTGAMVAKNLVLTAGHVLYDLTQGYNTVTVWPGGLYSNYSKASVSSLTVNSTYMDTGNYEYDYGFIELSSNTGNQTGWYGTQYYDYNSSLNNKSMYVYGYPYDKDEGTLWYCEGTTSSVSSRYFYYDADSTGGMSGGPVVLTSNWNKIVGVHEGGTSTKNGAVRMNSTIVNYIKMFGTT